MAWRTLAPVEYAVKVFQVEEGESVWRIVVSDLEVGGVLRPARSFETGPFATWLKMGKLLNLDSVVKRERFPTPSLPKLL